MTLEEYFQANAERGVIDYRLRYSPNAAGPAFYLHAEGVNSDTLDYRVSGDVLTQTGHARVAV